jgi:hypothetical protein
LPSDTKEISILSPRRFENGKELPVLERLYKSLYSLRPGDKTRNCFRGKNLDIQNCSTSDPNGLFWLILELSSSTLPFPNSRLLSDTFFASINSGGCRSVRLYASLLRNVKPSVGPWEGMSYKPELFAVIW